MRTQFRYFRQDLKKMVGTNKLRYVSIWFSRIFWGLFLYRFERGMFMLIGKPYRIVRIIFIPFYNLLGAYSNIDINYKADIKGGISILHSSLGIVISGFAVIGSNLQMTGGNVIGTRPGCTFGSIKIGDNCVMGAQSVILGPINLGNFVKIGACACVIYDCIQNNLTLIGVPAKPLAEKTT